MTSAGRRPVGRLIAAGVAVVAGGAALVLALGPAAAAHAATPSASPAGAALTGRIVEQSSTIKQVQVLFAAVGLGPGQSIDPKSVQLYLDDTEVPAQATAVGSTPPPQVSRTAMLVVDVSGSMRGAGLAGAKQAATVFLSSVPSDVDVGLITVSTTASLVAAPTTDRAKLRAAVAALTAHGNTALYDATLLAEQTLGSTGSRTIVLLTDGHDDGSKTTLAQAVTAAKSAGVVLDAVSFGTAAAQVAPLKQLTAAAGGRVLATNQTADIAAAFRQAAQDIATEVVVTASIPAKYVGTSVTVAVKALVNGIPITDSAFLPLTKPIPVAAAPASASPSAAASAFGPQPVAVRPGAFSSAGDLQVGIAAVFLGLVGLLSVAALRASVGDTRATRVRRRLSFYTLTGRASRTEPQPTALGDSSVARSAVQLAGRLVGSRDVDARLARRLEASGVPLKPAEWIVVQVTSAVGVGLLFLLLGRGSVAPAVLGVIIGIGGPIGYLLVKESRRSSAFLEQLPDTLQLIAGSMSVGHSLPQAMDAVVREELLPMSVEFNRALVETRLGMPVEDALEGISLRMDSRDFAWIVMAIRIQREVGGNLAEILNTVAATIRERQRLRRQVKGLSAEGRLSAWILGSLPPLFATYLLLVRPGYVKPLFTDPLGIALLVVMVVTMAVGIFWLSRVVRVEV